MASMDVDKMDSIFIYLIESSGNLPNFFDNMFAFFLRKSDFYKQGGKIHLILKKRIKNLLTINLGFI